MVGRLRVEPLKESDETEYRRLVSDSNEGMFSHTLNYRNLLNDVFDMTPEYSVAKLDGDVIGALPLFVSEDDYFGGVVNSLPFFGSPGGVLVAPNLEKGTTEIAFESLLDQLFDIAEQYNCVSSTVVTSQFTRANGPEGNQRYERRLADPFRQDRICQVVELPSVESAAVEEAPPETTPSNVEDANSLGEVLFLDFEGRTRRAVRKPYKEGLSIESSTDIGPLYEMHREGMKAKDGTVKPKRFFESIDKHFGEGQYHLHYAYHRGKPIAGLLLFSYGNAIEYFTPAYDFEYRDLQATSMLIFEGMKRAIQNGKKYWNFGGTRESQESLYRFKRGWGAEDWPYHYYTILLDGADKLLNSTPEDLLDAFPWFYSVPFEELKS